MSDFEDAPRVKAIRDAIHASDVNTCRLPCGVALDECYAWKPAEQIFQALRKAGWTMVLESRLDELVAERESYARYYELGGFPDD